jgi:hypothetical protein
VSDPGREKEAETEANGGVGNVEILRRPNREE